MSDSDFDMESQSRETEKQRKAAQKAAEAANKARSRRESAHHDRRGGTGSGMPWLTQVAILFYPIRSSLHLGGACFQIRNSLLPRFPKSRLPS